MLTINKVAQHAIDATRYLAGFTATGNLSDVGKARKCIELIASHELCGLSDCTECKIAAPLWEITMYFQRLLLDTGDDE